MKKFLIFLLIVSACDTQKSKTIETSVIVSDTIKSEILNKPIAYQVYLPSDYESKSNFPILYLLHGHGGSDDDWFNVEEGNAKIILDSLIRIKKIKPLVAITLNAENSWYVDSKEPMEKAYIKEFIPFIESKYKVSTNDNSRIIAGNSAGGFGALRFSLKYPSLFHSSILLSPAAYNPLPPEISSSRKIPAFAKGNTFNDSIWNSYSYTKLIDTSNIDIVYPKFYTSTGDDDTYKIFNVITTLKTFFDEHDIANETLVINGGHSWYVWQYCFTNDLVRIFKYDKQ